MNKYKEYKELDLSNIHKKILKEWKENDVFQQSVMPGNHKSSFAFYEGPPSANGAPGIHHVIARTIKDLFCRYKSLKGYHVNRKAGWDTHGLPVELGVEQDLNITKEDIGKNITIEDYNKSCRENVMRYKDKWEQLTDKMGYWVDMENPYVTYDNKYIESVWWLLAQLHKKELIYKGFTIQPYSPKAGTGLSTHELNQPGCYRDVKDTSAVAMFRVINDKKSKLLFNDNEEIFFLAWTTTPWTLPSNTALAVGRNIQYVKVATVNFYTSQKIIIVMAKDLLCQYFKEKISINEYKEGDKDLPYEIIQEFSGKDINGVNYEQLFTYKKPEDGDAFRVILADFVTTEDGTGIVHIAPSFGSDDNLVAKKNGIGSLTLVDQQGRFVEEVTDLAGEFVKEEYYTDQDIKPKYPVDVQIVIKLKENGQLFRSEKYEHSYPHCWRTDKPILYYPMDSWFIKTTDYKKRMIELNNEINWKPESTGKGRFGNWLENLLDWNLSRSRFWGIPIPIWRTDDGTEEVCIDSLEMLKNEIEKSVRAGIMKSNPLDKFDIGNYSNENYNIFDLHRPYVDEIVLMSQSGKSMTREPDLIDVWFDSGSMPYAQLHYPFENKDIFEENFPADFIAEGVDQTRGWFFTLHAISTMLFDSVAYKNVVSNGLVLDKDGNKMSKRLGNAVDPFVTLDKYGADACRWYMISNAQPWDNLKFDESGIQETQRKFFGTLHNAYSFFTLYANIDKFIYDEDEIPIQKREEIDRWILSELNSLVGYVDKNYENYEPTKASRLIQDFVINKLSNWYIRLSRRRFWRGEYNMDKISAYQTLYTCLETVSIIASPISPFFMENLFLDLNVITNRKDVMSVHLSSFPNPDNTRIDHELENKMSLAQKITTMVLSLRKQEGIRVRQPLRKITIPVDDEMIKNQILAVNDILLAELNIKEVKFISTDSSILTKKIKPNFKTLGPKFGQNMQIISKRINEFSSEDIQYIQEHGNFVIDQDITIDLADVEIISNDIPGSKVISQDGITIALDINISDTLKEEGLARDFVNRIQNIRRSKNFEVTDKIKILVEKNDATENAIANNLSYICSETLADSLEIVNNSSSEKVNIDLSDGVSVSVDIKKI